MVPTEWVVVLANCTLDRRIFTPHPSGIFFDGNCFHEPLRKVLPDTDRAAGSGRLGCDGLGSKLKINKVYVWLENVN